MPVYSFGSNEHRQISSEGPLHVSTPIRLDDCLRINAASWSRVALLDRAGNPTVRGLPLDFPVSFDASTVKSWLGQDEFVATLHNDGSIHRLEDGAITEIKYRLATMDGRGAVLVVPESNPTSVWLYPSLSNLFDSDETAPNPPTKLELPFYPSPPSTPEHITSLSSGSAHFLLLTCPSSRLFSIGDNRYGQLGVSSHPNLSDSSPKLYRVDTFDGLKIVQISTGSFHSVVLTESGQVYSFGSDQRGQCGGTRGGPEPVINDLEEEEEEEEEEEAQEEEGQGGQEIVQVCAFGESTILRTRTGEIFVSGANHSGQLGLEGRTQDSVETFIKHPLFGPTTIGTSESPTRIGTVKDVVCSRWTTYLEVEEEEQRRA